MTAVPNPCLQHQLIAAGFELPVDASPDRMRRSLAEEIARWTPVTESSTERRDAGPRSCGFWAPVRGSALRVPGEHHEKSIKGARRRPHSGEWALDSSAPRG